MESTKCRACRSMNHATSVRCINCGAPLQERPDPIGGEGVAQPVAQPSAVGWISRVPAASKRQRRASSSILLVCGSLITLASVVLLVLFFNGAVSADDAAPLVFAIMILSSVFWFWMLIDAISHGAVAWALAIFFFGTLGALLYLFLGRPRAKAWPDGS